MNIVQFFADPAVRLPKDRNNPDFLAYLQQINADYLAAVNQLTGGSPLCDDILVRLNDITTLRARIEETVETYLDGRPAEAFSVLSNALTGIQNVQNLVSVQNQPDYSLYRMSKMRRAHLAHGKPRIFHIPYNRRDLVGHHRYAIPGFPCLYLGTTLRVCQIELGIQNHNLGMYGVARFRFRQPTRYLDFGYRPRFIETLAQGLGNQPNPALSDFIVKYAVCWPLIAACSIKRIYDEKFIAEYIVPRLTLEWVREQNDIDGIRFFSTRMPMNAGHMDVINHVLPAKLPARPGTNYSEHLHSLLELTDPIIWQGMNPSSRHLIRVQGANWRQNLANQFGRTQNCLELMALAQI